MKTQALELIKKLEDLHVKVNEQDWHVEFSGKLGDDVVIVSISLSVAPSVQSMLSRSAAVEATLWIRVNGGTAVFDTAPDKAELKKIGGYLHDLQDEARKQMDEKAYNRVKDLIDKK